MRTEPLIPREVLEDLYFGKVAAKFAAARVYCNKRGWVFRVIDHVKVER